MSETRPILVVGAGPAGLTAALELSRLGIPIRLIDQYAEPSSTSRAIAIQSRTLELMHQRDLADEMLELGNRGMAAVLYDGVKRLGKVDLHQIESRFNFALLLSQAETERILRERLDRAGVRIERQTRLVSFSQPDGSTVRAILRNADGIEEELDAAFMIDAEGAHSVARHQMQLPFEGNSLPNSYAIADLYLEGDVPEDELSIYIPDTGLLAVFPMGQQRFRIVATERAAIGQDAAAPTLDDMATLWAKAVPVPVAMRDLQWSSRFRINSRALRALRHGRVFFAGDSAHIHSPAGGQGMNTGIQDAINLGWKLALAYRSIAGDALLDTYDEERLPIIHQLIYTTEKATDTANSESHLVHVLMRNLLPRVLSIDAVRRKAARVVSEHDVHYRNSSLNGTGAGLGSIHVGDRFPDVSLLDGEQQGVLDLLDPSRLTVLMLGTASSPAPHFPAYRDLCVERRICAPSAALTHVMGHATVAVVRPDGYLLCAGDSSSTSAQLDMWLQRWLLPAS